MGGRGHPGIDIGENGNGEGLIVVERNGKVCMDGFMKIEDEENWMERAAIMLWDGHSRDQWKKRLGQEGQRMEMVRVL